MIVDTNVRKKNKEEKDIDSSGEVFNCIVNEKEQDDMEEKASTIVSMKRKFHRTKKPVTCNDNLKENEVVQMNEKHPDTEVEKTESFTIPKKRKPSKRARRKEPVTYSDSMTENQFVQMIENGTK